jgi:hypothetical protein
MAWCLIEIREKEAQAQLYFQSIVAKLTAVQQSAFVCIMNHM